MYSQIEANCIYASESPANFIATNPSFSSLLEILSSSMNSFNFEDKLSVPEIEIAGDDDLENEKVKN